MFANSWWQQLFTKLPRTPVRRKTASESTCCLQVEHLENRWLPANIFVVNFADGGAVAPTPIPGQPGNFTAVNLRSAVQFHNLFPGASTIFLKTSINASSTYKLTSAFGGQLDIAFSGGTTSLTIKNRYGQLSVIDAIHTSPADKFRLFRVHAGGSTTFDHLRLTHGDTSLFDPNGGAIRIDNDAEMELDYCQISNNNATGYGGSSSAIDAAGGGIYSQASRLTLKYCTVDHNTATGGNRTNSFSQAAGGEGGGLCIGTRSEPAIVQIIASTFSYNKAPGGSNTGAEGGGGTALGGGLELAAQEFNAEVDLTIINSTFANNIAQGGNGGNSYGSAGSAFGGGLFNGDTNNVQYVNDTIAFNQVIAGTGRFQGSAYGGGIWTDGESVISLKPSVASIVVPPTDSVALLNTIVAKNTAKATPTSTAVPNDVFGDFFDQGHNLIGTTAGSTGFTDPTDVTGTTAIPANPGFAGGLAWHGGPTQTIALNITSKAINAGDDRVTKPPYALSTDQRGKGFARKSGLHVDIGAYEFPKTQLVGRDLLATLLGFH